MSLLFPLLLAITLCNRHEDNAIMHIVFFAMAGPILWMALFSKTQNFRLGLGREHSWLAIAFVGYTALLVVNPLLSEAPHYSIDGVSRCLAFPLGFFLALTPCVYNADCLHNQSARITTVLIVVLVAAWGIAEFSLLLAHVFSPADWAYEEARAQGPYMDVNLYGAMMNICLLAVLGFYLQPSGRTVAWCVLALLSVAAATTQSRGATLALLATLPLLCWATWKDRLTRKKLLWGVATIATGFTLVHCSLTFFPQQGRQISRVSESDQCRLLMWKSTLSAWEAEGGLLGTGVGTYRKIYPEYRNPLEICSGGTQAHNDYLQSLLEGGPLLLIGLIIVAPLASLLILSGARRIENASRRSEAACFAAAALATALHALVNFVYIDESLGLASGFCIGTAAHLSRGPSGSISGTSSKWNKLRDWLRPTAATAFLFYLVCLGSNYIVVRKLVGEPKNDLATARFANFAAAWMPWNPFPHLFLAGKMYGEAKTMEAGPWRDFRLVFAYRELQQLIHFDRHNDDAWIHLSELLRADTTLDPATSPQQALANALTYNPANYDARTALANQKLFNGQSVAACRLMEGGLQWFGLELQTAQSKAAQFLESGEKICRGRDSPQEHAVWLDFIAWLGTADLSQTSYAALMEAHRKSGVFSAH